MKLCVHLQVAETHAEGEITVIDRAEIIDLGIVPDNHDFGWAGDGTLHLEARR